MVVDMRSVFAVFVTAVIIAAVSVRASLTRSENEKEGAHRWEWDVNGAADPGIGGFTDKISYGTGEKVTFFVVSVAKAWGIDIYRLGYYGGDGARLKERLQPEVDTPQRQPHKDGQPCTGCSPSTSWRIPANAASGVYLARLYRRDDRSPEGGDASFHLNPADNHPDAAAIALERHRRYHAHATHFGNRNASHVLFVVRSEGHPPDRGVVYRVADMAWATTRIATGGTERAFTYQHVQRSRQSEETNFFAIDYPAIRFLERAGFDVHYVASTDLEGAKSVEDLMHPAKVFAASGFDAAWSEKARALIGAMPQSGAHRMLFTAGDAPHTAIWDADLRGFKEVKFVRTGTTSATGVRFSHVSWHRKPAVVRPQLAWTRLWRNSRFATITQPTKTYREVIGRHLGTTDPSKEPPSLVHLTTTPFTWTYKRTGETLHHDSSTVNHSSIVYRDQRSRAVTFVAASSGFARGLDALHDVYADAMDTPFGTTPRRIHLDPHPLGAESGLQQLVLQLFGLMDVQTHFDIATLHQVERHDDDLPSCEVDSVEPVEGNPKLLRVRVQTHDRGGAVAMARAGFDRDEYLQPLRRRDEGRPDASGVFEGVLTVPENSPADIADLVVCIAIDDSLNTQLDRGTTAKRRRTHPGLHGHPHPPRDMPTPSVSDL
jgi:hypothetical protein